MQTLQRKARQDNMPKYTPQERADWRAELPVLASRKVTLRALQPTNATSLVSMLGSPAVARYISLRLDSLDDALGFIEWTHRARQAGRRICFGVVPRGWTQAVGVFQLWPLEPTFRTAEWEFALGDPFWGTGLFVQSARLVADFAFETIGAVRIEGRSAGDNGRGNAALRKLGAEPEGRLRRSFQSTDSVARDHILWALLDDDWRRVRPTLTT